MMHKVKYILGILLPAMLIALTACQEDELFPGIGPIPEGETTVQATISFQPFAEGLTTRSAGGAIKTINNLCVFVYTPPTDNNAGGELVSAHYITSFTSNNVARDNDDAENGNTAETTTPKATFNLTLPYGAYCIYAVANMGDLTANAQTDYNTIDKLKSINLTWHSADANDSKTEVADNNEMFGYFTATYSDGTAAPTANNIPESVVLNKPGMSLHSWIKRAASKVTVAYDATNLNNNVYIYLKSVTIKDFPKNCFLGKDYPATPTEETNYQAEIDLIEGETIKYADDTYINNNTIAKLPCIVSGSPYYYYGAEWDWVKRAEELSSEAIFQEKAHAENMEALYFYENLQGKGITKMQDADGNKQLDRPGHPKWTVDKNDDYEKYGEGYLAKDGKTYGTYIEVKAYYVNKTTDVSEGEITYRFMLGQDTETDYNAKRNYHYKVTLCFKGDANDVDWHIEYHETEPALYVPDVYYISYLYDQKLDLPIKVNGEVTTLKATITANNWWPDDATSLEGTSSDALYYTVASGTTSGNSKGLHNGFLSLVRPRQVTVFSGLSASVANEANQDLWNGNISDYNNDSRPRGERIYKPDGSSTGYDSADSYRVESAKHGGKIFYIPLFTRSKNLGISTGHTGNNLFSGYTRSAEVEFTATFENGEVRTKSVKIIQVKRLVNPTGIWRRSGNAEPFNVVLMEEDPDTGTDDFVPVVSHGGWRAYVESGDDDWILLNGKSKHTVEGGTESQIKFEYKPASTIGENEVRCGVIRIDYNDYTCTHRIFVRQGYAPMAMPSNPTKKDQSKYYDVYFQNYTPSKWHTFNLEYARGEVYHPVDEGSLFKAGNLHDAILSSNNKTYGFNVNLGTNKLTLKSPDGSLAYQLWTWNGSTDNKLYEILPNDNWSGPLVSQYYYTEQFEAAFRLYPYYTPSSYTALLNELGLTHSKHLYPNPWLADPKPAFLEKAEIASFTDYAYLEMNFDVGYGVLYSDLATETASFLNAAYGYGYYDEGLGMRGCFIYDVGTGHNLFFPIGATGYGRRLAIYNALSEECLGSLRYGGPYDVIGGTNRPFLFDLFRHQGAIYWCKEAYNRPNKNNTDDPFYVYEHAIDSDNKGTLNHRAWDINYYAFGFHTFKSEAWPDEHYTSAGDDIDGYYQNFGSDACFIRLVEPQ
ncbi:MAG: hypothetical protein J6C87_02740 [Bacteroides sp.]|nr:hypothetical protein [Bacteroides sp.]MBO5015443.1 hypothetical protein [Bacteroidaceae bacterium]